MTNDDGGHRWQERSRHVISEGTVIYEGCHCGVVRVRAPGLLHQAASASAEVGAQPQRPLQTMDKGAGTKVRAPGGSNCIV